MINNSKKSQVTVFIIIAVVITAGILIYFSLRKQLSNNLPENFNLVYNHYIDCLKENAKQGIKLLGEQGGYINVPEFVPGSQYRPFSSQLDFFGQPVPYWMYLSGNNLLKEQVPTKESMEDQLQNYIWERLDFCDFDEFIQKGYSAEINLGNPEVTINDNEVKVIIDNKVNLYFENDSVSINKHEFSIQSKLGKFYNLALKTYNYEKQKMFLEYYALDVLRLYSPVTGVELSCSPKVFVEEEIKQELINAFIGNIGALKLKGNYYSLSGKESNYFVTDIGEKVDENVNFIYSPNFPTRIDIYGDVVAKPVGLQEGLGIMGFCYVPYHFVYDINFPVLIQFYDSEEIFQFPVAVVIDKNQARKSLPSTAGVSIESEVCKYKPQLVKITTYDIDLNPVESKISFKCLEDSCSIGETKILGSTASYQGYFPQCVNGFIVASAEGYADRKYMISTNKESYAEIFMNKLYKLKLTLDSNVKSALISFNSEDYSTTVYYPYFDSVELVEGHYNVTMYIHDNSTLKIPKTSNTKCVNVPKSGIGGIVGMEEERCFDITLPEQELTSVVIGGGKSTDYFTEEQLRNSETILISSILFEKPKTLDEVQKNYGEAENADLEVSFK